MSESVGLHMEHMIPELEQMKRIGLFKPEEINDIIRKRKEFEYKTERTMKEKQDFLRYINYEVKLLREIKLRRDKLRIGEKKSDIEYAIAKRVVKLYQIVLSYFQSDVRMWMSYINFCTQTKFTTVVTQAFKQMLQVHADQKNLWLFAAKWELSESNNIEGALNYLKTGLHHHPDSKELYTESFKLELQSAEKFHNKNSPLEDQQQKASSRATVHFRAAAEMLGHDIEFLVSLLNTATEFEYTEELQAEIIEYLTKHCWRSEIMWHTMAQRELHGHHFNKDDINKSKTQLCVQIYKHAVQVLPTSQMWERYLDALIEIYHDEKRNKSFKSEILDKSFEDAYNDGFLQEKHYLVWLDIQPDEEKYIGLLKKASEAIPNSLELWLLQMKYYTTRDDLQMVVATAKKAIELLKDDSLQIYACLTKYYQMKTANAQYTLECQKVYESGIENGGTDISLSLRPMYIQWLTLVRSIKFARIEYEKMVTRIPHCLELHKKMIELEQARFNPSIEIIRNVHRTACSQFGASKTEVWMDLIKFEREYGDSKNISDIYNNAKTTLNDNLVSIFMTDFAILNSQ